MTGRRLLVEADGGSRGNPGPAGYGAVVRDADTGEVLREVAAGIGRATNNVAEYEGLLAGLRAAAELDPIEVEVRMDSKLVVEQMTGRWQIKHPDMRELAKQAAAVVRRLPAVRFQHVPRARNTHADRLANEAMDAAAGGREWAPPAPVQTPRPVPPPIPVGPPTGAVLVRHGSTPLTAERRFSGLGEARLSPLGTSQAEALADRLAGWEPFAALVSSPLTRTRQTAEIIASRLQLDIVVEERLREVDFGAWDGLSFAEVQERWPAELAGWLADPDVAPPGGESVTAATRRICRGRDRLLAAYAGLRLLVVTHATPIKTLVRVALDAPVAVLDRLQVDPTGLTELDWYPDGPVVLRRFNDVAHLPAR